MKEKLISIIIPTFNNRELLSKCVESIIAQTVDNYEILIIDDGSSDGTNQSIKKYLNKNIKYFYKNNSGVSSSRNYGIKVSKGDYIVFVDSDDYCDESLLEEAYNIFKSKNVDWVIYGYSIIANKTIKINVENNILVRDKDDIKRNIKLIEEKSLIASPWTSMYKSDIIKKNKIFFDEELNYGEDVLFNLEYLKYIKSFYIINKNLYNYVCLGNESLTTKYVPNRIENMNKAIEKRREVFRKFNMNDDEYRIHFANMYVKSLYFSVTNLFHKKCEMNNKQIILNLKYLLKNDQIKYYVSKSNLEDKHFKILKHIFKINNEFLAYCFFLMIVNTLYIKNKVKKGFLV